MENITLQTMSEQMHNYNTDLQTLGGQTQGPDLGLYQADEGLLYR